MLVIAYICMTTFVHQNLNTKPAKNSAVSTKPWWKHTGRA